MELKVYPAKYLPTPSCVAKSNSWTLENWVQQGQRIFLPAGMLLSIIRERRRVICPVGNLDCRKMGIAVLDFILPIPGMTWRHTRHKDVWLMGGSSLFRSFLDSGYVDRIDVAVIPVLLGAGVPLLPPPYSPTKLKLLSNRAYRSGRLSLAYEVQH